MREYWEKPKESEAVLRDGWYRTGDMGFFDDRNLLHLTDRLKDMIVTGGENVYSTEVENAIASHPAVQEVAVIGIPSDIWGEAVHAIVVLKRGWQGHGRRVDRTRAQLFVGIQSPEVSRVSRWPASDFGSIQASQARAAAAILGKP